MSFFYFVVILCSFFLFTRSRDVINYSLTKEKTDFLKGILAMSVLVGHLSFLARGYFPYSTFYHLGLIGVNAFLFISGYGLMMSLVKKGNAYLDGFLKKRLSKIIVPFLIAILVFFATIYLQDGAKAFVGIYGMIKNRWIDGVLPFSWYVYSIIYLYFMFYVVNRMIKNKLVAIGAIFVATVFYTLFIIYFMHLPNHWYKSSFAFVGGLLYGYYIDHLTRVVTRYYRFLLAGIIVLTIFAWYIDYNDPFFIGNVLIALVIIFLMSLSFVSKNYIPFLSKISYEIYLTQGIAMYICEVVLKLNDIAFLLYFFCSILCTILLAYFVSTITNIVGKN